MKFPKVSIIVLNFNGINDTKKCLKSLLKTTYKNFQIFLVDNGSDKNHAEILKKIFNSRKIHFIRLEKNLGFTGGNNLLMKQITDKYILLLNNDVEVPKDWLNPLVDIMEKNSKIAVVQPKILWSRNKKYFDYAGACGGYIDIFGYPFTRGRIFSTIEKDTGQYDTVADIFWASGAAMMIRSSVLKKVGYFDEQFFNYMEEIDLCFRIRTFGYRVVCEPSSYVYHKVAGTASRNERQKRFWEHRNNVLLIIKNYPFLQLIYILPIRMTMEYMSILYYLLTKRIDYALGALKSQVYLIYLVPKILLSRILQKKISGKSVQKLIFAGSIVQLYFVLKKRKFSDIIN